MSWFNILRKATTPARPLLPSSKREVGALGEKLAQDFLKKRHYRIIGTNHRHGRLGEIDIVAIHRRQLVFVEVRTKTGSSFGLPEESITRAKKEKLVSLALNYLQTHRGLPAEWRIDVVAVELDKQDKAKRIEIIENAIV